jgi:DNA polymerase
MDIAKPFIMKHIELISPDMLVLCGGVAAQTLLNSKESISRLRGTIHDVSGRKAIATYHPAFLLRTPLQKKKVWQDMLMLQETL